MEVALPSGWMEFPLDQPLCASKSDSSLYFYLEPETTTKDVYSKQCKEINISNYKTITLVYGWKYGVGNSTLEFGIYDTILPNDSAGRIVIASNAWNQSGGRVTVDVSDLSGVKYVGFQFYGNAYITGSNASQYISGISLTAVEREGYTLTYNANGGSGAPSIVSNIVSTVISSIAPTRSGYVFLGWSTSPSATSANYMSGDSITLSSNTTLYAVWEERTYSVLYYFRDGYNGMSFDVKQHGAIYRIMSYIPTKDSTEVSYTVTLDTNGGICSTLSLSATRTTSYSFREWNTGFSGTGTSYMPGDIYVENDDLILYGFYNSDTTTDAVMLPIPTRDGYQFMGWAISSTERFGMTGSYTPTENVTLYAIWEPMGLVYICDHAEEFSPYQVLIYDGSDWNQYIPYICTESGWEVYSG